ncbi:MAG: PKD domain-containing protein [Bacteroidota bacterium]
MIQPHKANAIGGLLLMILMMAVPALYGQRSSLKDPKTGKTISYDIAGKESLAIPVGYATATRRGQTCATPDESISNAIIGQVFGDQALYNACKDILNKSSKRFYPGKNSKCVIGNEMVFGAGYYMFCIYKNSKGQYSFKKTKDTKLKNEANGPILRYQVLADIEGNNIYIAEKLGDKVSEIVRVKPGVSWIEPIEELEPYERRNPDDEIPCLEPTAIIGASTLSGPAPLDVSFSGKESFDADQKGKSITKYTWDFGDGQKAEGVDVNHTFEDPQSYTVTLQVTDNENRLDDTTIVITVTGDEDEGYFLPPTAVINTNTDEGCAPLYVSFDATGSQDQDEGGASIENYKWTLDGEVYAEGATGFKTFTQPGSFELKLIVTDNEGMTSQATRIIKVLDPEGNDCTPIPPPPPPVPAGDCCCNDTVIIVQRDTTIINNFQNDTTIYVYQNGPNPEEKKPIMLSGGVVFKRVKSQLTEYGIGATGQIRYQHKSWDKYSVFADIGVLPLRKATPLDDRPFKWSGLRDSIDVATGLPLSWHRGTERGTATLAIGAERTFFDLFFLQIMGGVQRTFQQKETSNFDLKDPFNEFVGFDLEIFYGEARLGIRHENLEIFFAYQLLEENRPFVLIPPNVQGGTFTPRTDKSYNAGIQILF